MILAIIIVTIAMIIIIIVIIIIILIIVIIEIMIHFHLAVRSAPDRVHRSWLQVDKDCPDNCHHGKIS